MRQNYVALQILCIAAATCGGNPSPVMTENHLLEQFLHTLAERSENGARDAG